MENGKPKVQFNIALNDKARFTGQTQKFVSTEKQYLGSKITQPAITCLKLTIKILAQGVKYVQS